MNRKLHEPLTFGKHDKLTHEINEMSIAIKLHHMHPPERTEKPEQWAKAQSSVSCPTWENVLELLEKARREMDTCRYNPVKY